MSKIRVRIAPSPTGLFHLGNLRSALTNFLFARSQKGTFIVRVEDTDQARLVPEAIPDMLESLKWVGIEVDEGVIGVESKNPEKATYEEIRKSIVQKGDFGSYVQSERLPIYQKYIQELLDKGLAYYCFCSSDRLKSLRDYQNSKKMPPKYDRACLKLSEEKIEARLKKGDPYVVRLKSPEEGTTEFNDLVRGKIEIENKNLDDPVLMKSDGFPTYHFAVVVDDHLMEISHVFRGEEWIPSTPKHILIYQAFGWESPQIGHLPTVLSMKGGKLSKRDGDVSIADFRRKGYLPEAIVNFISLLGWNPKSEKEFFTLSELIQEFDMKKLNKAAPRFDWERLDWFSSFYVKQKSVSELVELCLPYVKDKTQNKSLIEKIVKVQQPRMKVLSDILVGVEFIFDLPEYSKELLAWKEMNFSETKESLEKAKEIIQKLDEENFTLEKISETMLLASDKSDRGRLLWPLRVALSGQKQSPSPFECLWMLGKEESIRRIEKAISEMTND